MQEFSQLIDLIRSTHSTLQQQAVNAVNKSLTVRNWLIGFYIVEYEQNGEDRAQYGEKLLFNIAKNIQIKGLTAPELSRCRQFYKVYPQIIGTVSQEFKLMLSSPILETLSQKSIAISGRKNVYHIPPLKLITNLSFSHIIELIKIEDNLKRTFYEIETIKNIWSVRELKRQINTLYYERSALSAKPEKLSKLIKQQTSPQQPADIIKNIYSFEFLDLKVKDVVEESDFETALLDNLQNFILELGNGFCFEARQKRILIGENYYFIDLVFYHRVLKCHVLIDLKIGKFEHQDIGQLNTYLNYYKENIGDKEDNLPVGILLVAEKDFALVKYATAGMDDNLFVKQYLINLPSPEKLKNYIEKELKKL